MAKNERLRNSAENGFDSVELKERGSELENSLHEKLEEQASLEKNTEQDATDARREAMEASAPAEKEAASLSHEDEHDKPPQPASKEAKKASFKATMKQVQGEMSSGERTFSKVIHNPVVEKTSDAIGNTIARPNAILAGAITAFVVVIVLYFFAKHKGFTLSGFEAIGAFAAGWLIGILFDFFKAMITGKPSSS